jgi:aspartokinase-like uncharacterized kinase
MIPVVKPQKNQSALPLVVKVGGSLFCQIPALAPVLKDSKRPLLIIPGGGPFADTVRQCNTDNDSAHWMAIAAMEQFGLFVASHGIPTTTELVIPRVTTVFLPYQYFIEHDVLPHTWDMTSDSIAAWVAHILHIDLLLLKSVDGIFINGILQQQVTEPVESDVIDPLFIPFVVKNGMKTTIINGSQPDRVSKYLTGGVVPRTEIGTIF